MYKYINIASDPEFKNHHTMARIVNVLKACPECVVDEHHWFKSQNDTPWFRINLRRCDALGNYPAGLEQDGNIANMIELIYMNKGDDKSRELYLTLAHRIAKDLEWIVLEDEV